MSNLKNLDSTTTIILIIFAVAIIFVVLFLATSGLLAPENNAFGGMGNMMNNYEQDYTVPILLSLVVALMVGVIVSLWLKPSAKTEDAAPAPVTKVDELEIIKRALSEDEKLVVDEICRAGEITQDSLRFRLEWSKAKLSRILTNLDKLNIIQRERVGKTYKVFLSEKSQKSE
jgi:uncharacterized membrane protein